jgi:hypothetical protein
MGFSHLKIKIMTKRYELIHLNGQMYMVDGIPSLTGEWYIDDADAIRQSVTDNTEYWLKREGYKKIVATTDPSLGLPLLPDIEEDVASMLLKRLAELGFPKMKTEEIHNWSSQIVAAKAKQYTKEDMWDAARFGYDTANNNADDEGTQMTGEEFQAFLQKLRPLPIAVEVEMVEVDNGDTEHDEGGTLPGAVTSELEPVIENGKIVVRKWIY